MITKIRSYTLFTDLWLYLKLYKPALLLFVGCMLVLVAFEVTVPLIYRYILDVVVEGKNMQLLGFITSGLILGFIFFRLIPEYVLLRISTLLSGDITTTLRLNLFKHLEQLSLDNFHKKGVSETVSAFSEDIRALESALLSSCPSTVKNLLILFLSYLLIFYIYYPIGFLIAAINLTALLIPRFFVHKRDIAIHQFRQKESELMKGFHEFLHNYIVLRVYSLLEIWLNKTSVDIKKTAELNKTANFYTQIGGQMFYVSLFLCMMSVILVGGYAIIQNYLTIGSVFSLLVLASLILRGTDSLTHHVPHLVRAALGMERINAFLAIEPLKVNASAPLLPPIERKIEFQNVSFEDNFGKPLNNINLSLNVGKSVAFVGPSGSGKTAILKILMRLLEPTEGKIVIDDKYNLNEVEETSFRNQFGVVLQESLLFNLSIKENIRLGKPGASDEEVIAASTKAKFHDNVLLFPQGYDTEVGQLGARLSGGQRQRLALARALIRSPKILLLDEVTSALDAVTEAEINENLLECRKVTTLVVATHRLQITPNLDYLYVLDKGEIVEKGSHQELLQLGGLYTKLWQKQNSIQLTPEQNVAHINVEYLKEIPILQQCPDAILEKLSQHFLVESYAAGETVVEEGTYGDTFFLVARGELDVIKGQKLVASSREGDFFGEIALLYNVKRVATVKARTYAVLLQLSRSHFHTLLQEVPEVKEEIEALAELRMRNEI